MAINKFSHSSPQGRLYFLLVLVIVFWGVNWPIMKIGIQHISPLWFATTRMFLGSLFLFGMLAYQGRLRLPTRADRNILIAIAIFQIALPTGLIHSGLLYLGAGHSAILVFTMPLWVAPLAVYFLGERLSPINLGGLALGFAGVIVLLNPMTFDFTDKNLLIGNAFMLVTSFSFAIAIILMRRRPGTAPIIQLVPWQLFGGSILLAIAAFSIEGTPEVQWSPSLIAILAYNGPIASGFCFWAFLTVSRDLPAINTAIGSMGVPVIGVLSSALILNESLTLGVVSGLGLILLGVLAVSFDGLRRSRPLQVMDS